MSEATNPLVIERLSLTMTLLSDTTFGSGDGVAGLVDVEVQHDPNGLPYLGGRTLRGMLREACELIVEVAPVWKDAKDRLFGESKREAYQLGILRVGNALLPKMLREVIADEVNRENAKITRQQVLESLTAIRRQTAVDEQTGAAKEKALRASRVIIRGIQFAAELKFRTALLETSDELALLAATTLAFRRAGMGRSRGRGEVTCRLINETGEDVTERLFDYFCARLEVA